jgi:hypothetical protein
LDKSGGLYSSWSLAHEYGFTDVDGPKPGFGRHFDFEERFQQSSKTGLRRTISRPKAATS